jgi:two-component system, NtrC family, nitrogen regulation response regulator NtrX
MASDILVVDDEADIRELVAGILEDEGHMARTAGDSDGALAALADRRPSLVFLDIWLQGSRLDGLALLDIIHADHPDLPVVMISGHGNIETAVAAIKRGAYEYIEKPFKADRLVLVAERALEASKLKRELADLRQRSGEHNKELVGTSAVMNHLRHAIERISPTNSRVMIFGPSGAGKELAARAIHAASARASGPFVVLNAATITPERMEVELFGTEPGNGTRKVGAMEEAHGGTLYLDEIGDMPRETQGKILRVLVDQTFERIGAAPGSVDVRILSSTARDLEADDPRRPLSRGSVPPPQRRAAHGCRRWPSGARTFPLLVQYFMEQVSNAAGLPVRRIGDDAMAVLQAQRLAGQPAPAAQQYRAADDPDARLPRRGDHRRHAAAGDRPSCPRRRSTAPPTSWRCRCAKRARSSSANI